MNDIKEIMVNSVMDIDVKPVSRHGYSCITDCVLGNTKIMHPALGRVVTNQHDFCAINEYNNDTFVDVCHLSAEDNDISKMPRLSINEKNFLKVYYQIENIQELSRFLKEGEHATKTVRRLLNLYIRQYVYPEGVVTEDFIDILQFSLLKYWKYNLMPKRSPDLSEKDWELFQKNIKSKDTLMKGMYVLLAQLNEYGLNNTFDHLIILDAYLSFFASPLSLEERENVTFSL